MKSAALYLLPFLFFLFGQAGAFDPLFDTPVDYFAENKPIDLFAEDFDNDGDVDLAVADEGSRYLSVFVNDGSGAFTLPQKYLIEVNTYSVSGGDLDGDGDCDLVVTSRISSNFSILINDGTGTFSIVDKYRVPWAPRGIYIADLDSDGDLDVVVASYLNSPNQNFASIFLNNGDGTFNDPGMFSIDRPWYLTGADMDQDGDQDLLLAGLIMLNDGNAGFTENVVIPRSNRAPVAADFDDDGDIDLAISRSNPYRVQLLLNNGNLTFTEVNYDFEKFPDNVCGSDFDRDGDIDIVVTYEEASYSTLIFNNGDGSFGQPVKFNAGQGPGKITGADFDGDGAADLAKANHQSASISIILNNGRGEFPQEVIVATNSPAIALTGADFDGNGYCDLAALGLESSSVFILSNDGSGKFAVSGSYPTGDQAYSLFVSDLDGDNDPDLAVTDMCTGMDNGKVLIYSNNGGGSFSPPIDYNAVGLPRRVCGFDVDADGDCDLITTGDRSIPSRPFRVGVLFNNGYADFSSATSSPLTGYPIDHYGADFDGDSDFDLAVLGYAYDRFDIFLNNGVGEFSVDGLYPLNAVPRDISGADFNGDGDCDIVTVNTGTNKISVFKNAGDGSFPKSHDYDVGREPMSIFVIDLNTDGFPDLAVGNSGSRNITVLLNDGTGGFQDNGISYRVGRPPGSIFGADFDQDGDNDLAVADTDSNYITILYNRTIRAEILNVWLDIKPGSCPNPLNMQGNYNRGKSVLPVAVLGTESFDVRGIVIETITLGGVCPLRWNYGDVSTPSGKEDDSCICGEEGPDGYEDLILKFDKKAILSSLKAAFPVNSLTGPASRTESDLIQLNNKSGRDRLSQEDHILTLSGQLKNGTMIEGNDCVRVMAKELLMMAAAGDSHELVLEQNYPNPFNPITKIAFTLPVASDVKLEIFNILGQKVTTLVDNRLEAGPHNALWDGSAAASGIYFYRLTVTDITQIKKMLLLK